MGKKVSTEATARSKAKFLAYASGKPRWVYLNSDGLWRISRIPVPGGERFDPESSVSSHTSQITGNEVLQLLKFLTFQQKAMLKQFGTLKSDIRIGRAIGASNRTVQSRGESIIRKMREVLDRPLADKTDLRRAGLIYTLIEEGFHPSY